MGTKISAISYFLPDQILDNIQLSAEFPEWEATKIMEKVGINRRHISGKEETAVDLAFEAAKLVLEDYDPDLIDFVILCTQSPDYFFTAVAIIPVPMGFVRMSASPGFAPEFVITLSG
jgi:3-oxoacyl-[acyl-carrier-protein] synthase-3